MRTRSDLLRTAFVLPLLVALGCALPGPVVEMGENADVTFDGLHRVRGARAGQRVWVKPDMDLSSYSELILIGAGFHYKRPPKRARGEYALNERQMDFVREELASSIREELIARGDWTLADRPGPEALVLRGAIIDFVLTTAPEQPTRGATYSASVGAATLVIEVFDSQSREILARIVDRRGLEHDDVTGWRNDPISNAAAARRTFRHWARKLANALEKAHSMPIPQESVGD
ncbi:MAG: DUF3313 domain-containing protein [bacterium]|nr:DUF3313 domain-containing protein [bacterium]